MVGQEAGAKLEAAIDGAFAVEAGFEFEFEVGEFAAGRASEFAAGPEEVLVGVAGAVFGDAGGDGAFFDGPVGGFGSLPAGQGVAVEDGCEIVVGGGVVVEGRGD